ncbi:hypothetical protein [Serratia marcescens]|uniref:hypothetical protein n=1 Tax=Serratia marcescens TaxID=615 RepID=UPI003FA73F34
MNNTLSELSKPVAWKLHHHDRYYYEENADVVTLAESMGQAKGDALYSQEYVSALLAELEKGQCANNSAPAILRQLAEEKQKRGEVAAATAFNYAASALQKELSK